jgi:hypothetical protein
MLKDFHYYGVFVLSNLAGFSRDEAKIIAYCSQFVDDSTDSKEIRVGDYTYDTVRTAHAGLRSFKWDIHKKVYFPFHFLPPRPLGVNAFSYVTEPDSAFARLLMDDVLADKSALRLYRLGVVLHTYADTWAHQKFSGRNNIENDIQELDMREDNIWKKCKKPWKHYVRNGVGRVKHLIQYGEWKRYKRPWDFFMDLLRARVGHLQASNYPDYAYAYWRYKDFRGEENLRCNPEEFLAAAEAIFYRLAQAHGQADAESIWQREQPTIKSLLEASPPEDCDDELQAQCDLWIDAYETYFQSQSDNQSYLYDPSEWRDQAMSFAKDGDLESFLGTHWVQFQRAALKQRYFVLERMM